MLQKIPGLHLVSEDRDVYDNETGDTYTSRLYDYKGHRIEVTEDRHGFNAKAGNRSRVRMDVGGLYGFFLDLFGKR